MPTKHFLARFAAVAATLGLVTLTGAGTASAHVTANADDATRGGYAKVAFRVPNERPDAGTVKVRVMLPLDHPLSSVSTTPVPGWDVTLGRVTLPEPVQVAGSEVTETVRSITWTARPGTRIEPDQFQEFEVSLGALPTDVDRLVLPTVQTYDNGEVVEWSAPPASEGAPEPGKPAPTLTLLPKTSGSDHSHGSTAAQAAPHGGSGSGSHSGDSTARWLGGAGLVAGALGLGLGAGALLRTRRARS